MKHRQDPRAARDNFNKAANDNRFSPLDSYQGFKPYSDKQAAQATLIDENDVTFSIGPAGTGKTHVAIAKAVEGLANGNYDSILLCRPAVEAGETIGFLPGDQNAKMAPYMRPLYDELDAVYGKKNRNDMIVSEENPGGKVEVAPVGTMRGRTFKNTFVIIDEAQNLKDEELKMVLTRLGAGSKIVITGDPDQIDLDPKEESGLTRMIEQLEGVTNVAVHTYGMEDVMRHPTVQAIVNRLDGKGDLEQPAEKAQQKSEQKQGVTKPPAP